MIAAQFGSVYDRRWARENLGWLFGDTPDPQGPPTSAGGASGRSGLEPLPWRHSRTPSTDAGKVTGPKPLSDSDQDTIDAFHRALGMIPETDEPPTQPDPATEAPIGWHGKAVQILRNAGTDTWLSAGEVRDALAADGTDLARQTVSTALSKMARRRQIRTRGTGPNTVYAAPENTAR